MTNRLNDIGNLTKDSFMLLPVGQPKSYIPITNKFSAQRKNSDIETYQTRIRRRCEGSEKYFKLSIKYI